MLAVAARRLDGADDPTILADRRRIDPDRLVSAPCAAGIDLSRQRGPDVTVTFRTHTPFNVEVRRIRSLELDDDYSGKLMAVLGDKVGQTQPGMPNLLWLIAGPPVTLEGLEEAAAALRALAERKEEAYFTRRGYRSAADFIRRYQQLSGIVLRRPDESALWLNPIARHKAPPDVVKALRQLA